MGRRSLHTHDELRELIIDAATAIIEQEGLEGLSAREIAKRVGYSPGTLYNVFENLDDLILHVNARTLDRLHARMSASQSQCNDAVDCLLQLGQVYIRFADEDPHRFALVFAHRSSEDRGIPAWYQEKITRMFALVEEALEPLARQRTREEITQASRALWGGVHGICILALTDNLGIAGADSVQDLAQSLISNYLKGFTGN